MHWSLEVRGSYILKFVLIGTCIMSYQSHIVNIFRIPRESHVIILIAIK